MSTLDEHIDALAADYRATLNRATRLANAIDALTADNPEPNASEPNASPTPPTNGNPTTNDNIALTLKAINTIDTDTFTANSLARTTPRLSPQAARHALNTLVEYDRVRVAGKRTGGTLYTLVDDAE